ncbi:MAG TPA: dihydrolipoyl dehydrogenase [Thermodesulfovibrionales bacterium]|nr:dihydrolipoyl dehydrogenase [Thermodesulfovibrionales bacterium]
MKSYDVVVIGAGDVGLGIVFKAVSAGLKVALIEKGPVGGTCINVGCVPSKTLIYSADRIAEIRDAKKFGIDARIMGIDFGPVMRRMKKAVAFGRNGIGEAIRDSKNLDFYNEEGHFVDDRIIEIGNRKIEGRKIFIASGARPLIPPIKGLEKVRYLTNESVLGLNKCPESIVIVGGGYIAVEYAHFFAAFGAKVTMLERGKRLVSGEEPEISDLLLKEMAKRMEIYTDTEVVEIVRNGRSYDTVVKESNTGRLRKLASEKMMIATGRISNADLIQIQNAEIETDGRNFIKVNDYLETNKKHIWALGDAIGRQMFTHAGDKEAGIAWHNANHRKKIRMDFGAVPHAVFTYPQIASIGLTEEKARQKYKVLVGKAKYSDTVKGTAMMEEESFAKAIVDKKTKRILGFHIIGPEASVLIQEVVNAVVNRSKVSYITDSMHIFPSLSEIVTETLNNLE